MPMPKSPPWSSQEIAILADVYPKEGIEGAADALPDRSWRAIYAMASRLQLRSPIVGDAPKLRLQGAHLAEAVRLREEEGWSFDKIGLRFGVCETSASNAVLIEMGRRRGNPFAPRDENGRLTAEGLAQLRECLRKGMKGVDITLRLGVSAACIAEQRRRYARELKAARKVALPAPGKGLAYSGRKLSAEQKQAVEQLFMQGYGTAKVSAMSGVSKTQCGRIRNRLIKRLRRRGETLPGCDIKGKRRVNQAHARNIPQPSIDELRRRLMEGVPCGRAARDLGIGGSAAYRIRDRLEAELQARGESLPKPERLGRGALATSVAAAADWLPRPKFMRYRILSAEHGPIEAKRLLLEEMAAEKRAAAEAARPRTFEEKLARVRAGVGVVPAWVPRRPAPESTLGGVASGMM